MLILLFKSFLPWPISRREGVLESRDGADSIIFDSIYVLIYITDVEQVWHSKDKDVHDSVGFVLAMRLQSRNKSEAHLRSIMLIKKIQFFDTKRAFIIAGHQTALGHTKWIHSRWPCNKIINDTTTLWMLRKCKTKFCAIVPQSYRTIRL